MSLRLRRKYRWLASTRVPRPLAVDRGGLPVRWLHLDEAVRYYTLDLIEWTYGDILETLRGGTGRDGNRSTVDIHPVIAVKGLSGANRLGRTPPLNNYTLFARDRFKCMYCGRDFTLENKMLTRDHIYPVSRGGPDNWMNVVAACKRCNGHKADKTPEEAHMKLLAVPYEPNYAEDLLLSKRVIVGDQMEFLSNYTPKERREIYTPEQFDLSKAKY